jgi:hypothetical protein
MDGTLAVKFPDAPVGDVDGMHGKSIAVEVQEGWKTCFPASRAPQHFFDVISVRHHVGDFFTRGSK